MVQVGPDHWIGLPTFDINEWFDELGIPPDERAGILERGGGYDGFHVSADLERESFQWLHDHGREAASVRTRFSDETMAKVARRFGRKAPGEKELLEHLERLDIRDELQRQAAVKAWGRPASDPAQSGNAKLSPRELASKHGVAQRALEARLERWRYEHDTGYVEVSNPVRNKPKYLYDESAVMPVIEAMKAKSVTPKRATDVQQKKE